MIETLTDGTIIAYLKQDFTPVDKADAEMVKIIDPDGTASFAYPRIQKDYTDEHGGLTQPTDGGGEINPLSPRRPGRRIPLDTEGAYTATDIASPTPGIMKAVADSGKAVAIDFDGTITLDENGKENPRMRVLVDTLLTQGIRVVIFTARAAHEVHSWLRAHKWPSLEVTNVKSPDFGVYLDDRAVNFAPGTPGLADKLSGFKAWWEKNFNPYQDPNKKRNEPITPAGETAAMTKRQNMKNPNDGVTMQKLDPNDPATHSADIVAGNIEQLKTLFPEAFTEGKVDFEVLKQLLGRAVDEREEKYGLNWHGKRGARQLALTHSTGTLRPCPEDSVDWDTTQNLMIEGDNLEVLKLLQKSYAGKVKLIYIDPPYNTGKDFVYPDNFQDSIKNYQELTGRKISTNTEASGRFHTDWLNMMYPRLKLARSLLREDGAVFISIDEKELQNLRLICNDVFGEECFIGLLTVLCNPKGRSQDKYFATNHEYILVFARSVLPKGFFAIAKDGDQIEAEYPEEDEGGKYRLLELRNTHREFGKHNRRNLFYPLFTNDESEVFVEDEGSCHKVLPIWDDGFEGCWTWDRSKAERDIALLVGQQVAGRWKIYRKSYASGADRMLKTILVDKSYFTERGQKEFNALFGTKAKLFQSPKSPYLLAQLLQTCTGNADLILDFFAGSGTTGHAVMMQNVADGGKRRYALVQLPEPFDPENKEQKTAADFCDTLRKPRNLAELTKERLRRAAKKIKDENPLFSGDLSFRVFKLDSSNIRAWEPNRDNLDQAVLDHQEHLKGDRTEADIFYELLLKLGLDLCVPIEKKTIAGKAVHSIGGGVLIACLAEHLTLGDVEPLAQGIVAWHQDLSPAGDTTCIFRDSAFADDVAKTNLAAILSQHGLANVRSL